MGPLTWVMAWVVWSASQSTVPVVWTATAHVALPTTAVLRWLNWSAESVNIPGCARAGGLGFGLRLLEQVAGRLRQDEQDAGECPRQETFTNSAKTLPAWLGFSYFNCK